MMEALSIDPGYARQHSRLLTRAREWEGKDRAPGYLLTGGEVREFNAWLRESQTKEPKPTELQLEYLITSQSRRARQRVQSIVAGFTTVIVLLVTVALALYQNEQVARIEATGFAQEQNAESSRVALAATGDAGSTALAEATIAAAENATLLAAQDSLARENSQTRVQQSALLLTSTAQVEIINQAFQSTLDALNVTQGALSTALAESRATVVVAEVLLSEIYALEASGAEPTLDETHAAQESTQTPTIMMQTETAADVMDQALTATALAFLPAATSTPTGTPSATPSATPSPQPTLEPESTESLGGGEEPLRLFVSPIGSDDNPCTEPREGACATIAHALSLAGPDAVIEIGPGIYTETLTIDQPVTLRGGDRDLTVINGGGQGRVITIAQDAGPVRLENLTITGGSSHGSGGGVLNQGDLMLANVTITANSTQSYGGGIANFGALALDDVAITGNYAAVEGGLYTSPDAPEVEGLESAEISGNTDNVAAYVQTVADYIGDACLDRMRNTVCVGGAPVTITLADGTTIEDAQPGDRFNLVELESIRLLPSAEGEPFGGMVVIVTAAALPDTLPGQGVTFIAHSAMVGDDGTMIIPASAYRLTTEMGGLTAQLVPDSVAARVPVAALIRFEGDMIYFGVED
jgi:hypothetical protein